MTSFLASSIASIILRPDNYEILGLLVSILNKTGLIEINDTFMNSGTLKGPHAYFNIISTALAYVLCSIQ